MPSNVAFDNIESSFLKNCFLKVHQVYKELHNNKIYLRRRALEKTNMQAQPVINRFFWNKKKRHYHITISNDIELEQYFKIKELPEDVLIGWLAHEMGHLMDYAGRSGWSLLKFGLGYLLFPTHRIGTERRADVFAIEKGFSEYLVATKKFILEHSKLPNTYKERIERYYLSVEEVGILSQQVEEEVSLRLDKII